MFVTRRITRTQRRPARHWAASRPRVAAVSGRLQASRCGCADCARCVAWAQVSGRRRKTGSGKAGPRGKPAGQACWNAFRVLIFLSWWCGWVCGLPLRYRAL